MKADENFGWSWWGVYRFAYGVVWGLFGGTGITTDRNRQVVNSICIWLGLFLVLLEAVATAVRAKKSKVALQEDKEGAKSKSEI